ncbi:MAG: hypothetical protein BWY65_01678 [Firmicutes bacterium ADurb.Bin373]|jgi:hypothetical protein|nr:MAG: hypothetical protein BWY65_01678 [Firmicutes bacterium ADurb.Bin373]
MKTKMGLCRGRHDIPGVDNYIFPSQVDPLDLAGMEAAAAAALAGVEALDLYVTGLTVALVAVINYCRQAGISLTLWHFDRESGDYYPQPVA